jgi:hypothetical protein
MSAAQFIPPAVYAPSGPMGRASGPQRATCIWTATALLRRGPHQQEAYAVGPDGFVWSHETTSEGQAAGRLISTGLKAHRFAVGLLPNRRALVVGVQGNTACYVLETGSTARRWEHPSLLACAGLRKAAELVEVHTLEREGELLIGFLARRERIFGPDSYQFWVGAWTGDNVEFRRAPVGLNGNDPLGNEFLSSQAAPARSNRSSRASFGSDYRIH